MSVCFQNIRRKRNGLLEDLQTIGGPYGRGFRQNNREPKLDRVICFGLLCSGFGLVVILLNWFLLLTTNTSVIDIGYATGNKVLFTLMWCIASGVVGFMGALLQILNTHIMAAISVAVGWPLIFTKIVEIGSSPPVQHPTAEE
jgi:hypothetical protein